MGMEEAVARAWNLAISPKYSREIAATIRGMPLKKAKAILERVIEKKQPIVLRKHNKEVPHHYGKPARYPVKAAQHILEVLKNAEANALYKGMDSEKLFIYRIETCRGGPKRPWGSKALGRARKRGRRTNIVVVLREAK